MLLSLSYTFHSRDEYIVPPAELEAVLLQHPDIADSGVVGVMSHTEATELPRYAPHFFERSYLNSFASYRAYVVPAKGVPESEEEKRAFATSVQKWMEGRVARHKFLRGGVVVIDAIPKR